MGQTGAVHPPEEGDGDGDGDRVSGGDNGRGRDDNHMEMDLVGEVVQDQDSDIRHDSIPTADHEVPSVSPEHLTLFHNCLATLKGDDQGGLLRSLAGQAIVWDPLEVMRVGQRRQKELVISLEDAVWERRALLWLAALRVLDTLL